MNIENPAADSNVQKLQKNFEENFNLFLNFQFVKEVFEEAIQAPNRNNPNIDDRTLERIFSRIFQILTHERIESLVDNERQQPMMVQMNNQETQAGVLSNDWIFKILDVINISEKKENWKKITNNRTLKFALSNGREQLMAIEEAKLVDVPPTMEEFEGFLLYVKKGTSIRRGIVLLSDLTGFLFKTMDQFRQRLQQLTTRIEKHNKEVEKQKELAKQKQLQAQTQTQTQTQGRTQSTNLITQKMQVEKNDDSDFDFDDDLLEAHIQESMQRGNQNQNQNQNQNHNTQIQRQQQQPVNNYNNNNGWNNHNQNQNRNYSQNQNPQKVSPMNMNQLRENIPQQNENNNNNNNNNNQNNQLSAEECEELLNLLYGDD